jgi:hypothetical protein
MDWEECINKKIVKSVRSDDNLVRSLIVSSRNKLESGNKLEMNDVTSSSKISLAYDSLRELLEALALKRGYKIYNHECYTAFLKEIIGESNKGDEFDKIRKIRNASNYYGKIITASEANRIISNIKYLRSYIYSLL